MDILNAGIVHTAAAAGFGVQGGFKHRAEDGGADFRPVKVFAGVAQKHGFEFLGKRGNLNIFIREQTAVHIRKRCQGGVVIRQVRVTVLWLCVQNTEQLYQGFTNAACRNVLQIIMEHSVLAKDACILSIKAEHQANAEHIQAFQRGRIRGILVLFEQGIVQFTHQLARLQRNLHFFLDTLVSRVHQELQAVVFLFQFRQRNHFRGIIGAVHVVDVKLLEIADHNPSGIHIVGQITSIAAGLLERGQHGAVTLLVALSQVNVCTLLLNQYMGIFQITINEAGMAELHRHFKFDCIHCLFYAEHILKQSNPKQLGFLLFIAVTCPVLNKLLGCGFLLCICHLYFPPKHKGVL